MHDVKTIDFSRVAQDLQIRRVQVESVVQLLDEGNTVPFITRYRKERTGGLDEEFIRAIQKRVQQARQLAERKQTILKSIEGQGKLTDELRQAILAAETPKRLEDLYLPFKPKKRTLATTARERGLEPLALAIWGRDPAVANLDEVLPTMVNPEKELATPDDVRLGVQHILAEMIAENADVRAAVRAVLWDTGRLTSAKNESLPEGKGLDYKDYFQFTEPARHIPPHRILAINRGEKEGVLKVKVESDLEAIRQAMLSRLPLVDHPQAEFLKAVAEDALTRLLLPSLEREVRRELTDEAEIHAVKVFARNLRSLLLQAPLLGRRVLAIDPGFRTGCKLAALDEHGNLLEDGVIHPHPPQNKKQEAKLKLEELVRKHQIQVIAIGNGTACRETEELVADLITDLDKRRRGETGAILVRPEVPHNGQQFAVATIAPGAPSPESGLAEPLPAPAPAAAGALSGVAITAAPAPIASEPVPTVATVAATFIVSSVPAVLPPLPATTTTGAEDRGQRTEDREQKAEDGGSPVAAGTPAVAAAPEALPALVLDALPPAPPDLAYVIVNEAGASVYSASPIGREEFPNYDATLRGTISIGRRLQDPLSELVKIDPQNIGVGLYQHDISPRNLKDTLDAVIESSVNHVGVDLNTASVPLLRHVSGLNQLAARELVDYRKQHGPFRSREQLLQVPGIGPARYVQAAGFLKISGGDEPLDRTWIHPESYPIARQLLAELGYAPQALEDQQQTAELRDKLKALSPEEVSARLQAGIPTVRDIMEALSRPGRDPREDLPPPIFKRGVLKLEDLQPGMELKGTVLNVVDFGAFVDIGLKDSGLVHISQMANRYIKSPYDVVAVGDVVTVWVLSVDYTRRRVSLTMIKPGTERKPPERKPQGERRPSERKPQGERKPPERKQPQGQGQGRGPRPGGRPPRGRRPGPRPGQVAVPGQSQTPPPAGSTTEAGPPAAGTTSPPAAEAPPKQPARSAPPPHRGERRPPRRPPKAKLSQEALKGDTPLRTFSELMAFFEAKGKEEPKPKPPDQEQGTKES